MTSNISRPRVFLDISIGTEPIGRLTLELYSDKAPKTCENFRVLCAGEKPPLSYKLNAFHRIIDEFMIQGGDITKGDGTGGESIYGGEFADENIGWRQIDQAGLVCMANRGKDTNSSQFFITLDACPHLDAKHTVFGHLVAGRETLDRMSKVRVNKDDRPLDDVIIAHCGELERRKISKVAERQVKDEDTHVASSHSRGRAKRRHASSSRSRSPSSSCSQDREQASRYRHKHRRHDEERSASVATKSPSPPVKRRRRSDAAPDETLRGRQRQRSRLRSSTSDEDDDTARRQRKRSPPPSRPRSRSAERSSRRQRSLPNQYRDWRQDDRYRPGEKYRGEERFVESSAGRLGGGDYGGENEDGIVYKGRGAMKYREQQQKRRRW